MKYLVSTEERGGVSLDQRGFVWHVLSQQPEPNFL